ncbi:MAG TPA: Spy/CpxP family protein refolding chaperone [Xanthobacteraceae bacterium]|nr:Spy/CpxP family protein refolding chaperone [Xanthobacteraceae bacterium]
MWKAALVGTAAIAVLGSSFVYAQQRGPGNFDRGFGGGFERFRPNLDDMNAFVNARLAALHAGLGLTPDQEKNWPAFEQASRELAKLRLDRVDADINARRDRQPQSNEPGDRLHQRAAELTERGAALKKVADAVDPLYNSLDDAQKRRFAFLERILAPRELGTRERQLRGREDFAPPRNGPRQFFDGGPRRTDYTPQGPEGGEEQL